MTVDEPLSFNVQTEMLLGKCCLAAGGLFELWLISPGWKDHGTEEDLYDQSQLIKEEALPLSGVICIHCSDVKCLLVKGNRTLSVYYAEPHPTLS